MTPATTTDPAAPVSLRGLALAQAERLGFPSVALPSRPCERVAAGQDAWALFTAHAWLDDVADALLALDDVQVNR